MLSEETAFDNIYASMMLIDSVERMSDEKATAAISNLVNNMLPKDMFEQVDESSFIYKGGFEEWLESEYISNIVKAANALRTESLFLLDSGSIYDVQKTINNPLNLNSLFIISNIEYSCLAMESGKLMSDFVSSLMPGTRIYVGSVLDYRY